MSNCIAQVCSAALLAFAMMMSSASHGGAEGLKPAVVRFRRHRHQERLRRRGDRRAPEEGHRRQGHRVLPGDRPGGAGGQGRHRAPPVVLLIFGNPPLGTQFITANPQAGLDWPVRMLVYRDASGAVWVAYTDFEWIAKRHGVTSRDAQFHMASEVAASIASSVAAH